MIILNRGKASLACAFVAAGLFALSAHSTFAATATVRAVRGMPKYTGTNGFPVVLKKGDKVPAGVTIRTGMGESVDLNIDGRPRLVTVGQNSRLKLDEAENAISLEKGELVGSFRKDESGGALAPLTVRTPLSVTQVTVGDLAVSADQGTHSMLSGHQATVQPISAQGLPAAPITLSAGSMASVQPNGQPTIARMSESVTANLLARVDNLNSSDQTVAATLKKRTGQTTPTTTQASPEPEPEPTNPGTGTQGYWKNHEEAWPVAQIVIGGVTYTRDQAISGMRSPTSRDVTYAMFQQLVAAKLNLMIGNQGNCISATITAADAWMAAHPLGSKVSGSSSAWTGSESGNSIMTTLDNYNNGRMCAPHRG